LLLSDHIKAAGADHDDAARRPSIGRCPRAAAATSMIPAVSRPIPNDRVDQF